MRISDQQLDRFIEIYRKNFGITIDRATALEKGAKLVRLMEIIYKPMTKDEFARVQERQTELAKK